ncbi:MULTISPECIES: TlpA disulfide reductase family protein [unclassified Saccharopolyspora]|uniref:TlpA family protein disulfide reductase n=1 Tax=unclassified Saccharopolyspora TaxID=2646250 RepID=UPI001CD34A2A|nr:MULTISPECIES: TlpA disulfide reductase family protein [unclassified Saccharopolyspora]MCA1189593.1 TlpA family protein disulfide reductase [Saccharopolyspora sp. 6T]MCA1225994.1 TlpA family protein disulfide reductase [Saccharopolyspora sp. 6M]
MRRLLARAALSVAVLGLLGGCATAGKDAVEQGTEFTFVSPGGQTRIFYPEAERQKLTKLSGDSLLEEGKRIGLSDYEGKVVVVNLWGSWCGPCRAEADDLQAVQDKMGPQGVQVLGVDVRDSRSAAADFHRDRSLTYPSIFDPSGRSLLSLKNYPRSAVPSTIILDRQHRVAAVFLTEMLESELLPEVQKVAAEPAA